MKRNVWKCLLVALSLSLVLAACSESDSSGGAAAPAGNGTSNEGPSTGQPAEGAAEVKPLTVTLGGASPGGFWSLLGEGIGNILRENIPGTQFSYETGNGVKNVIDVAAGTISLGMGHNFEVKAGLNGEQPFPAKVDEVTALLTLYDNAAHQMVLTKAFADQYGISSMEDLVEKKPPVRVAVNQRGNLLEAINRNAFDSYGINYETIKSWGGEVFFEAWKPSIEMMGNNRVDLIGASVFAPDGGLLELTTSKEVILLDLNENAQKLINERMGMAKGIITAGTYDWLEKDVETVNAAAILMVDKNMPEEEAYLITKTIIENLESYKKLHNKLADLTPEIMANVSPAKLHPGAEKYFKEIGAIK